VDDFAGRALFDEEATPCAPRVLSATRTLAGDAFWEGTDNDAMKALQRGFA
jgi:hypothetical protein